MDAKMRQACSALKGFQFCPAGWNRRRRHLSWHLLVCKEFEHEVIENLWRFNGADMAAVLNHREAHVLLNLSKPLRCAEKDVVLRSHDHQPTFVHLAVDVGLDQQKERFVVKVMKSKIRRGQILRNLLIPGIEIVLARIYKY